ncbi:hypothetical protein ACH4M0_10750 [Streptomyces albidoflavus]
MATSDSARPSVSHRAIPPGFGVADGAALVVGGGDWVVFAGVPAGVGVAVGEVGDVGEVGASLAAPAASASPPSGPHAESAAAQARARAAPHTPRGRPRA